MEAALEGTNFLRLIFLSNVGPTPSQVFQEKGKL